MQFSFVWIFKQKNQLIWKNKAIAIPYRMAYKTLFAFQLTINNTKITNSSITMFVVDTYQSKRKYYNQQTLINKRMKNRRAATTYL